MILLALPGVQRMVFLLSEPFVSCNLQYTYLNFLSAEFFSKNNDFVAQVAYFHNKVTIFFKSKDRFSHFPQIENFLSVSSLTIRPWFVFP